MLTFFLIKDDKICYNVDEDTSRKNVTQIHRSGYAIIYTKGNYT